MRTALSVAASAMLLAALGGCGANDRSASTGAGASESPTTTTALPSASPAAAAASDAPSASPAPRTTNEIPPKGSDDFSAPPAARGDDTERVPASDGLSLTAGPDARTSWSLSAAEDDGTFCVKVKTRGVTDPDPLCNSGTQLALAFFTDQAEAHALADVDVIAPSKSAKPTDLVVAGVAAPDVKRIDVSYGGKRYGGRITRNSVRLRVDKRLAKEILDPTRAQLRSLPSTVTVRAFAVTVPLTGAAPPTTATATSPVPINGRMTFALS